jgi:UDP-N-acetylglucosamine--N-acetylmuramyl-(pentapeptide) pyrophosphoryl-undecaprenol N-acetylglucosamine transferase
VMAQENLTAAALAERLAALMAAPDRLAAAAAAAHAQGRPDAARALADLVAAAAGNGNHVTREHAA